MNLPEYVYGVSEVIRIVDGDTVDIMIDCGMYTYVRKRIRVFDIDTDELRGGTVETKVRANIAKDRITELLGMGTVYIQTRMDTTGKYGRLLGDFFVLVDGSGNVPETGFMVDVTETMVAEGLSKGEDTVWSENLVYV